MHDSCMSLIINTMLKKSEFYVHRTGSCVKIEASQLHKIATALSILSYTPTRHSQTRPDLHPIL